MTMTAPQWSPWLPFSFFLTSFQTSTRMIFLRHECILVTALLMSQNGLPSPSWWRDRNPSHGFQGLRENLPTLLFSQAHPLCSICHPTRISRMQDAVSQLHILNGQIPLSLSNSLPSSLSSVTKSCLRLCSGVNLSCKLPPPPPM